MLSVVEALVRVEVMVADVIVQLLAVLIRVRVKSSFQHR